MEGFILWIRKSILLRYQLFPNWYIISMFSSRYSGKLFFSMYCQADSKIYKNTKDIGWSVSWKKSWWLILSDFKTYSKAMWSK